MTTCYKEHPNQLNSRVEKLHRIKTQAIFYWGSTPVKMAATRISGFLMYKNCKYYFCEIFLVLLQDQMTAFSN